MHLAVLNFRLSSVIFSSDADRTITVDDVGALSPADQDGNSGLPLPASGTYSNIAGRDLVGLLIKIVAGVVCFQHGISLSSSIVTITTSTGVYSYLAQGLISLAFNLKKGSLENFLSTGRQTAEDDPGS